MSPEGRSALGRLSYVTALAVICIAPFERLDPMISLPGQQLTTVEVALVVALAAWLVDSVRQRRPPMWRTDVTMPLVALLLVMVVATLAAPEHRDNAAYFTGRFAVGALLMLCIADLSTSTTRLVGLMSAMVVSGTIVALFGILEHRQLPAVLAWLEPFRVAPNYAGGEIRVSSTLQYPTIASMYLEIVFAIGVGLMIDALGRRRWVPGVLLFVSATLVGTCVVLTLTRSGYAVMGLVLLLAGLSTWRRWGIDRRFGAVALLGASIIIVGATLVSLNQESWLRLTTADQRQWYQARYEVPEAITLQTGSTIQLNIEVENIGLAAWHTGGVVPFHLSYHWLTADRSQVVEYEGLRTKLPGRVAPGQRVRLSAALAAPRRPGRYVLAWDMVQEHRFWFSRESARSAFTIADVRGAPSPGAPRPVLREPPSARFLLSRTQLWTMAVAILRAHPWLGVGPDNFRLLYGTYFELGVYDLTYHTHNLYLEFFVGAGIVGGLALLGFLLRLCQGLWWCWRHDADRTPLVLGVAGAVLAVLAHGMLDYFFEFTPAYVTIFAVFGFTIALTRLARR